MFIVELFLTCFLEETVQIFVQNLNVELIFLNIRVVMVAELYPLFVRQLAYGIPILIIVLSLLISPVCFEHFQKLGLDMPLSNSHCLGPLFRLQYIVLVNELNEVPFDNLEHVLAWRLLLFWSRLLFISVYKLNWGVPWLWILFDYL